MPSACVRRNCCFHAPVCTENLKALVNGQAIRNQPRDNHCDSQILTNSRSQHKSVRRPEMPSQVPNEPSLNRFIWCLRSSKSDHKLVRDHPPHVQIRDPSLNPRSSCQTPALHLEKVRQQRQRRCGCCLRHEARAAPREADVLSTWAKAATATASIEELALESAQATWYPCSPDLRSPRLLCRSMAQAKRRECLKHCRQVLKQGAEAAEV